MSLDLLAVILDAFAPLLVLLGAVFLAGGVLIALATTFLFIPRVGIPRV
jgi:hypothetical protein